MSVPGLAQVEDTVAFQEYGCFHACDQSIDPASFPQVTDFDDPVTRCHRSTSERKRE
jgi:hypothetical protein